MPVTSPPRLAGWRRVLIVLSILIGAQVCASSAAQAGFGSWVWSGGQSLLNAIAGSSSTDLTTGAKPGDTPASLARQAFSSCFYCGMVTGIWNAADQVATNVASNLAANIRALAVSLFGMWLVWQMLLAVLPFSSDDQALGRAIRGAALFTLSIVILSSYSAGASGSFAGKYVYRPIVTATSETTAAIMGGIGQGLGMPNLGLGGDAGCSMSGDNVGSAVACASWQSARYAVAGLTIGYAMSTTSLTASDAMSFLVPYVVSVIFGVVLFVAWLVVLLAFPIAAASYILRVSVVFCFSPLMVVCLPYASARGVIGKAIRGLIGAGVQLWGLAIVSAGAGACIAYAIQASANGDVFAFITKISDGGSRIYPYQPAYLVLLAGAALTIAAMVTVHRQIAEFLADTSAPALAMAQSAARKTQAFGAQAGSFLGGAAGVATSMTIARQVAMQRIKRQFGS